MLPFALAAVVAGVLCALFAAESVLEGIVVTAIIVVATIAIAAAFLPEWRDPPERKQRTVIIMTAEVVTILAVGIVVRLATW
jgi:membrane protein implicated in regulation of membrane protease activity